MTTICGGLTLSQGAYLAVTRIANFLLRHVGVATPFVSFLFAISKWSARMYPACPVGDYRSTPAALMRSAHPCPEQINGLNDMAGTESRFQDAGSTDFVIMS